MCAGKLFESKVKVNVKKGWREIEEWILGKKADLASDDSDDQSHFIEGIFEPNKRLPIQQAEIKEGKTTPKKHFTEDTLLSAMEHASDNDMPEEAEHQGIGTPATRAGTIEKLVRIGFVERKGDKKTKYLIPTEKGRALISVMPEQIQSPKMTADWEQKLVQIEQQKYDSAAFLEEIGAMITNLVSTYQVIKGQCILTNPANSSVGVVGTCPCCGNHIIERPKGFFCENRDCKFTLWKENHFLEALSKKMTKSIAEGLIKDGNVRLKQCKSIKTGKTYDTTLVMTVDDNQRVQFRLDFEKQSKGKGR